LRLEGEGKQCIFYKKAGAAPRGPKNSFESGAWVVAPPVPQPMHQHKIFLLHFQNYYDFKTSQFFQHKAEYKF
jgi:hypothetical protein